MSFLRTTRKTLSDLTDPTAVSQALDEYDRLGRGAFLKEYGFKPARNYFVVRDGKHYDSKAIAGAAYEYQYPESGALRPAEFSGGEHHVMRRLTDLGFEVVQSDDIRTPTHKEHPNETQYWAFLANPHVYAIEDAVRDLEVDTWTTKGRDVAAGDRVLIWKAKGDDPVRGIVALGEVLTDPAPMADDSDYWVDPAAAHTIEDRVRVRYVVPPGLPLWLDGPMNAILGDLKVARARGGSVFRITPEQWSAVVEAAGGRPEEFFEVAEVRHVIEDLARGRGRGQGFQVSPEMRRAVEQHAMDCAAAYWSAQGWQVENVSSTQSYDLCCTRAGKELRVEVKGTMGDGSQVLLTPNEVAHARDMYPKVALMVVSDIDLTDPGSGTKQLWEPWSIEDGQLTPLGYSYKPSPVR